MHTLFPYLVLLRVGFAMPRALLRERCALNAPFHPYLAFLRKLAVYSLWHFPSKRLKALLPDVIRHTALRSSDFPLLIPCGLSELSVSGARATVRSGA
jgi:hypothetical protein